MSLEKSQISGEIVDFYIPWKCSITNNIISAKDHASAQISVAEVDEEGRMTGGFKTFAFCGKVRAMGEADDSFTNLCLNDGILPPNYNISQGFKRFHFKTTI